MRCKTCHYSLENLTELRCPECGRAFDPKDPSTFDPDRRGRWRVLLWQAATSYLVPFLVYGYLTYTAPGDLQRVWFTSWLTALLLIFISGIRALIVWPVTFLIVFVVWTWAKSSARRGID